MEKFGGHEYFLLAHILCRLAPRTIVFRLKAVAIGPRVEHHTLLRVELREYRLQLIVKAALIAVAPEDDAGVVDIASHHLLGNLCAHDGFVCPMPARQLALYIETERVAGIEEFWVGGIMRKSHGIHVH